VLNLVSGIKGRTQAEGVRERERERENRVLRDVLGEQGAGGCIGRTGCEGCIGRTGCEGCIGRTGCWGDVLVVERKEVTGDWRRLHNEKLHDFNCSPNITREITSSCVRWVGHMARMGRREMYTEFWCGKLKERYHLKNLGITWRIILKCTIKHGRASTGLISLKTAEMARFFFVDHK